MPIEIYGQGLGKFFIPCEGDVFYVAMYRESLKPGETSARLILDLLLSGF